MIDESEVEALVSEMVNEFPNSNEELSGLMVDHECECPDVEISEVKVWRESGGIPHFRATAEYHTTGEREPVDGEFIEARIEGILKQSKQGLSIASYTVHFVAVYPDGFGEEY